MRLFALALALSAGCGGGPKLTNLRCRSDQCQHPESPLRVLLAVDFEDATGTLGKGALDLRLNGETQTSVSLRDVFSAQGLALDAVKGTLQIDDDLAPRQVRDGQKLTVGLIATNERGEDSNEPTVTLTIRLGGTP